MSLLPHSLAVFESVGFFLTTDSETMDPGLEGWDIRVDCALAYLKAVADHVAQRTDGTAKTFQRPTMVTFLGGEPLMCPEDFGHLLTVVAEHRMAAEVWTTGHWVRNPDHAREVIASYGRKIQLIRIHTSSVIAGKIGTQRIEWLIEGAAAADVRAHVNCVVGPDEKLPRELFALSAMNSRTSFLQVSPDYLRAAVSARHASPFDKDLLLQVPPRRRCADKFGIFVFPDGNIYPCAQSAGVGAMSLGSLEIESIEAIVDRALSSPTLQKLRREGPRFIYDELAAREAGLEQPGFLDACDFHRWSIESRATREESTNLQSQGQDP